MPDDSYQKKDPLHGVAVLKLSLQLRGGELGIYDGIITDTCRQLGITEKDVDRYIKKHRAELEEVCRREGLADQ